MKEIQKTETFKKCFQKLHDEIAKIGIDTRVKRLANGNSGDSRFLGDISEMRIGYSNGYRIYYRTPHLLF